MLASLVIVCLLSLSWFGVGWRLLPQSLGITKRAALALFVGQGASGLILTFAWLAGWWGISWWLWLIGLILFPFDGCGRNHTNGLTWFKQKKWINLSRFAGWSGLIEIGLWLVVLLSLLVVIVWNFSMRPVVWDSLVLYDFRAWRIAEGWQISDFFTQFADHREFYAYDFSHPFGDSILRAQYYQFSNLFTSWRVSVLPSATAIYLPTLVAVLFYAQTIWKNRDRTLVLSLLMLASWQMLTTWTQGYAALVYLLAWFYILLVSIDNRLSKSWQSILLLLGLLISMQFRLSEPFWLFFVLMWGVKLIFSKGDWKVRVALFSYVTIPVVMIFLHWQMLQKEALHWVNGSIFEVVGSRSSYDLSGYATLGEILHQPNWWRQTIWLMLFKNPSMAYFLAASGLFGVGVWKKGRQFLMSNWWFLLVGYSWWVLMTLALLFEISGDPENWLGKQRLLWRTTLPISVWAIVASGQWWKTLQDWSKNRHS